MGRERIHARPRQRFGNISQRGGRWRARYQDSDGKFVGLTFDTKKDASAWLADVEAKKATGRHVVASKGKRTVEWVGARWLETQGSGTRQGTSTEYERIYKSVIEPKFGKMAVDSIDVHAVGKWMRDLEKAGDKAGTRKNKKNVLSLIMEKAIQLGCRGSNPCRSVEVAQAAEREEMVFLNHAEVYQLASAIEEPYGLMVQLGAYTGLRAGELWSLRVESIDFFKNRVMVTRSVRRVRGHGLIESMPKTWQRRSVQIPERLMRDLGAFVIGRSQGDLLFTNRKGGQVDESWFLNAVWWPAVERAKLNKKPRVHDLRHTCAGFYFAMANMSSEGVRRILGHSTIGETHRTYAHVFPEKFEQAVAGLDADIAAAEDMFEGSLGREWAERTKNAPL